MANPYKNPRVVKRKPRQRRPALLPFLTIGIGGKLYKPVYDKHGFFVAKEKFGTFKVTGRLRMHVGGQFAQAQALECTLDDGTLIPAYRLGSKWSICTNFAYTVRAAEGVKK